MNRTTLSSIAIIVIIVAYNCLLIDIATATMIYHIDPAYFYAQETNEPFKNFLYYQTFESTITFLSHLFVHNLLLLFTAGYFLYVIIISKSAEASLGLIEKIGGVVAVLALLYAIAMNLYGVSGNIQSLNYLMRR